MGKGQALDFKKEKSSLKHYTLKNQKHSRIIGVKTLSYKISEFTFPNFLEVFDV